MIRKSLISFLFVFLLLVFWLAPSSPTTSVSGIRLFHNSGTTSRRSILKYTAAAYVAATATTSISTPSLASSLLLGSESPILRLKVRDDNVKRNGGLKLLSIPRVGYSLYKTPWDEVEDGVRLALSTGVQHLDLASQYGSNEAVGNVIKSYQETNPRLVAQGKLFLTHKVSNSEQSIDHEAVKATIYEASLKIGRPIDMVMIHSPLTDKNRRLATYEALLQLQRTGEVQAVGVCNFGVNPLQEIVLAGMPPPAVIQLTLSPFNQHKDVVAWAQQHGSALSCSAWSKLSSVDGPQQGWAILADMAKQRGMTKAQVLVRWAIQRGYLCVPRSSSKYKIDRQAIVENSWRGTSSFYLSKQEMQILDGLDEQLPAGRLGLYDGWDPSEILDNNWDPTTAV